jgi:hypothetical protein
MLCYAPDAGLLKKKMLPVKIRQNSNGGCNQDGVYFSPNIFKNGYLSIFLFFYSPWVRLRFLWKFFLENSKWRNNLT